MTTKPSPVTVNGPWPATPRVLAMSWPGWVTRHSRRAQLDLMAHLSRWLAGEGLDAGDLTVEVAHRYVGAGARRPVHRHAFPRGRWIPLLAYLRRGGCPQAAPLPAC